MRQRSAWLLSAAVAAGIFTISCRDWRQADAFMSSVRCGMSIDDVRARARSFGATDFLAAGRVPVLYGTHVAGHGSSHVYLGFADGRLQWVRKGAQTGLWTGMRVGVKHDLCTDREFVSLVIHGGPGWERATVTVNGTVAGTLSPDPSALLETDVPLGRSELVIRSRASTYRKELSFDRSSKGVVQIDILE